MRRYRKPYPQRKGGSPAEAQAAGWRSEHHRVVQVLFAARLDGRNYRQQHGFLSICRLLSGRPPGHLPPFSASGRTMSLGGRAVDQMDIAVSPLHQGFKQPPPYSFGGPAMEAIVDGCRRAVTGGTILPTAARSQDMNDPADNPAVVGSMRAGLVCWKQGSDHRPLLVIKPEFSCHGPKLPLARAVNHAVAIRSIA